MNEFEYYLIGGDGDASTPLLAPDEYQSLRILHKEIPYEGLEPIRLRFNNPIPRNPTMRDYHSLPYSVVSKKVRDILETMNIFGVQFIPAVIRNELNGDVYEGYYIIHVFNQIECLDREKAKYTTSDLMKYGISEINKLVLDQKVLEKIPLEKRLVFYLKESISKRIYHKSIVDAVMAIEPDGLKFGKIEDWYEGIQFQR